MRFERGTASMSTLKGFLMNSHIVRSRFVVTLNMKQKLMIPSLHFEEKRILAKKKLGKKQSNKGRNYHITHICPME